jgi:hypothetical protein
VFDHLQGALLQSNNDVCIRPRCNCLLIYFLPTRPLHSAHISKHDILNIFTIFFIVILIINIPQDVWIVENIFVNNYTLDECTHLCITYSATAHPKDGQA